MSIRTDSAPEQVREIDDILVGEVWVGSGQSNMDLPVQFYVKQDAALDAAAENAYPQVRLLRSRDRAWSLSVPLSNRNFSALLFAFGLRLQEALSVPIGLLEGAVGGTPSGFWLSQEAYQAAQPAITAALAVAEQTFDVGQHQRQTDDLQAIWEKAKAKAVQEGARTPREPPHPLRPGEARGKVGHLFETHIRPFMPYAIRGVFWDQGENGIGIGGVDQVTMMGALIAGWRREWGQGDFPFVYVQIGGTNAVLWTRPADEIIAAIAHSLEELPHHRGLVLSSGGVMPPMCQPETIQTVCTWIRQFPARM
jgi:sialate O-acetylesterase